MADEKPDCLNMPSLDGSEQWRPAILVLCIYIRTRLDEVPKLLQTANECGHVDRALEKRPSRIAQDGWKERCKEAPTRTRILPTSRGSTF